MRHVNRYLVSVVLLCLYRPPVTADVTDGINCIDCATSRHAFRIRCSRCSLLKTRWRSRPQASALTPTEQETQSGISTQADVSFAHIITALPMPI